MQTCEGRGYPPRPHEEIVFAGGSCPLCQALDERDEARADFARVETERDAVQTELYDLRAEVDELRTATPVDRQG